MGRGGADRGEAVATAAAIQFFPWEGNFCHEIVDAEESHSPILAESDIKVCISFSEKI